MPSRNIILNNFWWKMFSLLLAVLLWIMLYTISQSDVRREEASKTVETESRRPFYGIPITLLTSPANSNHFTVTPETVDVGVGAKSNSKELDDLQPQQVEAFVDVTDVQDEKQFRKPIHVHVPGDLIVVGMSPSNATVDRVTSSR